MHTTESTLAALNSGKLKGATQLDLQADLETVPEALFELADTLEVLSLNNNQLTNLPAAFKSLKKLRILFCSNNPFTELPSVLGECPALEMIGFKACRIKSVPANSLPPQLRWLILTNNQLEGIPDTIGNCHRMQKLMLAGNQLSSLSDSISKLRNLELLRISANQFTSLPDWLYQMPTLAWLALAGNPLNHALEAEALHHHQLAAVKWEELTLNQQLGEGASGEIYHAEWQTATQHQTVAAKVFKGEMTSDGLPQSELAAAVAAGAHPNLTATEGIVSDHPDGKQVTVMSLLDPGFQVLAGPPSFESCTRDVYDNALSFSLDKAICIAQQIADATCHLHQKGLLHGDLYAHNILLNDNGDSLLSDFGGASFLPADQPQSTALQRIEVRAFGYFLEELIALVEKDSNAHQHTPAFKALVMLKNDCLTIAPSQRPLMQQVKQALHRL